MELTFSCSARNDLYSALVTSGRTYPRYESAAEAVKHASPGSSVLVLADGYPKTRTVIDADSLKTAAAKDLRLYIEYPESLPDIEFGSVREAEWERVVVASDVFGSKLPKLSILAAHRCVFVPVQARDCWLAVARVAGFDKAVYGLPEGATPILFEIPERKLIVATTKLSNFITGRFAPVGSWKVVWEQLLNRLGAEVSLKWTPTVRPAYGPADPLPRDFEKAAFSSAVGWYYNSRLLLHPSREKEVHDLLRAGVEAVDTPGADSPVGDGSCGILEGYASGIDTNGEQKQRIVLRCDCNTEAAAVLAFDWALNGDARSRKVATNLLDYAYFTSGMHGGRRGDPSHPAFGLIAWGNISPAWEVATYTDDEARVMLSTIVAAACLGSDRWDESLMRILQANLRVTGTLGFQGDRINMPQIEERGWRAYNESSKVNYSPHHESYSWACNLWAFRQTGYEPFITRTKTAIRMTMEAYPDGWRWGDSMERARMLLCLAWLVRLEDTPEHRSWLNKMVEDVIALQEPCGAIRECYRGGKGDGYGVPASNEAYGTSETPLIQENGDPVSDQLYTTGFALLGLHEAFAATGDPKIKQAEDRLAEYLCRIQIRSGRHPYLDGFWFRAFDYGRWEYWAASGDLGWGAWSVESGWAQAWTAVVFGLRSRNTSVWDLTSGSQIIRKFRTVREQMEQNDGGPWKGE